MPNAIPPAGHHNIKRSEAERMIANHVAKAGNIGPAIKGVTFNKDAFVQLLSTPGCEGIRFYFAFDNGPENAPTLIAVAVNQDGIDIFTGAGDGGFENSWPYPTHGANPANLVPAS